MTREEEMWEAVEKEHGVLSRRESFVTITAMEWADKTMIKKACDYLYKLNQMNFNEYGRNCPLVNVCDFRKVMEE